MPQIRHGYSNFYPRSPCGERHAKRFSTLHNIFISIHALLAESDWMALNRLLRKFLFLSTLSLRRATSSKVISSSVITYFYPRSPCGERQDRNTHTEHLLIFLSTLSLRRATPLCLCGFSAGRISIHALLAESDSKSAQNSGALLRIWNKFYGDCIFMLTGKAVFYPFCPCFFHIFWCEGTGNFMIAFPSH